MFMELPTRKTTVPLEVRQPAQRVVLYSHDTLGYGHFRRNLLLAKTLRALPSKPDVLMIAGMYEAGAFDIPDGVDLITLPGYAKQGDGSYQSRKLTVGLRQLTDMRARMIKAAVKGFRPQLVIVDNIPRGAQGELEPALKWLRDKTTARVVLGLRDVIDSRDKVRAQWLRQRNFEALPEYFSQVWIYGDPNLYNLITEYQLGDVLGQKAYFTGYLSRDAKRGSANSKQMLKDLVGHTDKPYILCMVGGGRDGVELCKAFAKARVPEGHRGILITGTQMSAQDRATIQQLAVQNPDIKVVEFVPEPITLLQNAKRIIAMGGYNTICEVLSLRQPALIVPRTSPRREQILRAKRLADLNLIDMVNPNRLTPKVLTDWMRNPARDRLAVNGLDMNGLARIQTLASAALDQTETLPVAA